MICFYGISQIGSSHLSRNIVCQDAHCIKRAAFGWTVGAIADGVGSSKHSDIASSIAVTTVTDFCCKRITADTKISEIEDILREAYLLAQESIEERAETDGNSITEYDTTLSSVVYNGEQVVYAHSGDGGIVGLAVDGKYVKITNPQKAADGICVIPLRAGKDFWEIGHCKEKFVSILMATDGVYDNFFPYLLRGTETEVYVPLIRYFMDNAVIGISEEKMADIQKEREDFLSSDACSIITDDKTVAVLINDEIVAEKQSEEYYAEPDWAALQEEWNRKAYPQLYSKKGEN